jgi:hypothetical protein
VRIVCKLQLESRKEKREKKMNDGMNERERERQRGQRSAPILTNSSAAGDLIKQSMIK